MNERMSQQDLISKAFYYWNSMKRHRALAEIKRIEGTQEEVNYHTVKMYQFSEQMELALRAIQKGQREIAESDDSEGD